ncbi:hypothetical protein COOONC_15283 [Cooperia oncophora]
MVPHYSFSYWKPYSCKPDEITQAPIPDYYHLHRLLKASYGINQAGFEELTGYDDCNYRLTNILWETGIGPAEAILKVSKFLPESENVIRTSNKICKILSEKGIPSPKILKRLDGLHLPVRLFEILPGLNLENFPYDREVTEDLGELLAKFHVIADESKLSVAYVPYIAIEHRRGILKEMELLLERSVISKERAKLIADCLAEFDERIANHRELHEIGRLSLEITFVLLF